ncbi:lysosomal protective protein-like [Oppia nitens]|uniref:lysosomal protective protein-like n=1 Tax=Oppia nitens TaxID=1686743 RepID=UPI0023DB8219|nr:lysosomal protective protein-like [Oppia nitens]
MCFIIDSDNTYIADQINQLPGLSQPLNFKQYSGYLNASKGRQYFYWFLESQTNPEISPVVLWLNGGPGCSSLLGLFTENGPFRVDKEGNNLTIDENSWNSVANILYLESPAGVGFSYVDIDVDPTNNDTITAIDNYLALQSFFERFSHLKKNPFYITGESYAGVYIPMLAKQIFENNSTINLKGVAIGNGFLDPSFLMTSQYDFAYSHGLMSTVTYQKIIESCCQLIPGSQFTCNYEKPNEKVDVRKAIHISIDKQWSECSDAHYKVCTDCSQRNNVMEVISKYKINNFVVYNGNLDFQCDFIADQRFVDSLGYNFTQQYREWKVNGITAGYIKRYNGLTFNAVRGAGHMVPSDKPEAALRILKDLIGLDHI